VNCNTHRQYLHGVTDLFIVITSEADHSGWAVSCVDLCPSVGGPHGFEFHPWHEVCRRLSALCCPL
jgi:hypothetical protein